MKNPSPITITIISAILAASIQGGFAQPSPRYIDKNCRLNQQLSERERFTLFNNSDFTANGQNYWFYAARYQDGAVLFCTSKPNFNQPKPLTEKQIQSQFIEKIARDPNNKTAFIILVISSPVAPDLYNGMQ